MPNNSFYIDISNIDPITNVTFLGNDPTQFRSPDELRGTNGFYLTPIIAYSSYYQVFLYNPIGSDKILKIKNYDYKYNTINGGSLNANFLILNRASGLSTGSIIEPYEKMNTNSADLPAGVGISLNPGASYVNSGSFRTRPVPIVNPASLNQMHSGRYGNAQLNAQTTYNGQNIGTTVQDITLNSNEHLLIGYSVIATGIAQKFQISVLFSSGSNTYYSDISCNSTMYANSSTGYGNHPAAFVNNSNTTIKIHRIEVNIPYRDAGIRSWPNSGIGGDYNKSMFIEHVPSDRIDPDITENLINSDVFTITNLDSTISPPSGVRCYKNSVAIQPPAQYQLNKEIGIYAPLYIKGRNFISPTIAGGITPVATGFNYGVLLMNYFTQSTKQKINYSKSGQEIVIRPGEGLGITMLNSSTQQDLADGFISGYVTFTAENVPTTGTTIVETGFGY